MANQLGDPRVTPREYNQHQRHSRFARLRYSKQAKAFEAAEATRLSSTNANIFAKLVKNTAARVKAALTYGSLS